MGMLSEIKRSLDQAENPRPPAVDRDQVLADKLAEISRVIERAAAQQPLESDTSKDLCAAIDRLHEAIASLEPTVTVEPAAVNVEVAAPQVNVESPAVSVEAPHVEVLMPDTGAMEFDIQRDGDGLMRRVVARPLSESPTPEPDSTEASYR